LIVLLVRSNGFSAQISRVSDGKASVPRAFDDVNEQLSKRIFGCEDWEFVRKRGSQAAQDLFLRERKRLAYAWLLRARADAQSIMRVHRTGSRRMERLHPSLEVRLGCGYIALQMCCRILSALVFLVGPVRAQKLSIGVTDLLARLRGMSDIAHPVQELSKQSGSTDSR
jgi:hypothetical protein